MGVSHSFRGQIVAKELTLVYGTDHCESVNNELGRFIERERERYTKNKWVFSTDQRWASPYPARIKCRECSIITGFKIFLHLKPVLFLTTTSTLKAPNSTYSHTPVRHYTKIIHFQHTHYLIIFPSKLNMLIIITCFTVIIVLCIYSVVLSRMISLFVTAICPMLNFSGYFRTSTLCNFGRS